MPHLSVVLLMLAVLPGLSLGQVVDDTLDWKRYFPLEVGNEWQYVDAESGPTSRFEIVDDTVVDNRRYFVGRETFYAPGGSRQGVYDPREVFLRYDSSGSVAEFSTPEADTGSVPAEFSRGTETFPIVDLRSSFGDTLDHADDPSRHTYVTGGYQSSIQVGGTDVSTAAVKKFDASLWFWWYAADVGFLGGGNLWGPRLRYARIGGTEYGTVIVSSESTYQSARQNSRQDLKVYPNPASRSVQVSSHPRGAAQATLEVFDIAGHLLKSIQIRGGLSADPFVLTLDVSSLPAGVYFVRLIHSEGASAASQFVISR